MTEVLIEDVKLKIKVQLNDFLASYSLPTFNLEKNVGFSIRANELEHRLNQALEVHLRV